jgi:hydroxymethylbilane synthase
MSIDHAETHLCLRAEREFLRLLHGDCNSPVGVHATIDSDVMKMRAQVFDPETGKMRSSAVQSPISISPETVAGRLMEKLNVG